MITRSKRNIIIKRVMSKTSEHLSSIITNLETPKEEEEEEEVIMEEEMEKQSSPAESWRFIHGLEDWTGMLDPMDPLLRAELIRYGEMAQACYDAFDFDPFSKYCGSCKFTRKEFFQGLEMTNHGYEVTRYLFATSNISLPNFFKKSRSPKVWSPHANWMGYIAVSNDEKSKYLGRRDITIAWRGTVTRLEWIADLMDILRPISLEKIPCPDPTVKVESGFLDLYTDKEKDCRYCHYSAREQILSEVKRLIDMYANEELSITVTGHSLGAALAILSAYDIVETQINFLDDVRPVPICVFSFAGPRVGNVRFKERLEQSGVKVLRVVNVHDIVPKSPGIIFNEHVHSMLFERVKEWPWSYVHVGVELELDHKNSPFLKEDADLTCAHNLEAYLHLLDGYHGKGQRFVLASGRDPALVNKACDFLKDHYMVPPFWRQDHNKGMVRNYDGRWIQAERPIHEDQPTDVHHHLCRLGLISDHL
ncbi:Fungal lipase-like domain [Dillenia turbinata]|uniref:Fungal lipase-like domain n=1 Tax=Dillenia turbinata TaxID=194707 RepID=A0AAN8VPG5_9MAGN